MKITAGLGRLEDYRRLVNAGADELFAGFVPLEWLEKYGNDVPLNRREALLQDIQLDCFEDMRILAQMQADAGVPLALTFNSPFYSASVYPMLADILADLQTIGYNGFIIGDTGLLVYLRRLGFSGQIHLSGEAGVYSPDAVRFFAELGVSRIIFPRKISPKRMADCIHAAPKLEYEAFFLNEKCHYSGAYCSGLHCDFFEPICRAPYVCMGSDCALQTREGDAALLGASGCGFCRLQDLASAGVHVLKVVGRGGHIDWIERDVRTLRAVLDRGDFRPEYLRESLFQGKCSQNCYYKQ